MMPAPETNDRSRPRLLLRRILRDPSSSLVATQVVLACGALLVNILAARVLGPSGRGELAFLLQVGYLSSLGILLGTDKSVVALYSGQPAVDVVRYYIRLLRAPAATGLVVSFVLLSLGIYLSDRAPTLLALAAVFALTNAVARAVRTIAIAAGRTSELLSITILSQILLVVLVAALTLTSYSTSSGVWLAVYVLTGLTTNGLLAFRWTRSGTARPAGSSVKKARRDGLVLLPSAVASSGMLRVDRLILPVLASTAALGVYATIGTMTELLSWPLVAFADSRVGRWRSAASQGPLNIRPVFLLSAGFSAVFGILLTSVIVLLVIPILGPGFADGVELVPGLVVGAALFGISRLFISALVALDQRHWVSVSEMSGLITSIAAYVWLIPTLGAMGAVYGSIVGYSVCLSVAVFIYERATRSREASARWTT